ncbi:hypothetical protein Tco_0873086 [Tanacetum coccineum]
MLTPPLQFCLLVLTQRKPPIYPKKQSKPHDDKPRENEISKTGATDEDHHAMVKVESEHKKSEEEEGNTENIKSPSQSDPSISFITKRVRKLNSFLESSSLVPQSFDTKFVCTKGDDGDIMFNHKHNHRK